MNTLHRSKKFSLGFTLLELLVVISIIGILVAMAAVSYTTAQQKARDARRRSDVDGWSKAMEQYYANNNGSYPGAGCSPGTTYLPNGIPTDPKTGSALTGTSSCDTDSFCLCADLEDSTAGNRTAAPSGGGCGASGAGTYFCISNQQ